MRARSVPLGLLLFLTLVNILNFFDRYIVHAVEPVLKSEFSLTNEQSGYLAGAFVIGYVIFCPLFGFFSDRVDRRFLMAFGLFAWSAFTALTGVSSGFAAFLTARILVGVGEASFGAIVPAYLKTRTPDVVSLNSALSVFYVAIPVGSALGFIAGGVLQELIGWRQLFLLAAVPGVLLSAGFFFLAKDTPVRTSTQPRPSFFAGIQQMWRAPVLRLTIVGYILHTFALNGVAWFVVRHVTGLGMSEGDAAQYFGINLVVTGFLGAFGGGLLSSRLAKRARSEVRSWLVFVAATVIIGVPFLSGALVVHSPQMFFVSCFVAQLMLFAGTAPLNSVLVARAPAGLEGFTQGVTIFSIQLFGSYLAPVAVGKVADVLIAMGIADKNTALAYGLQLAPLAMVGAAAVWLWAAARESASKDPIAMRERAC
jgi:MFS family permease